MAEHFLATALGCARRVLVPATDPAADAQLLDRFVRDRDESAFQELVARHGPLVWSACRRGTNNVADAEDAFQATFLVLARRAGRVRQAAAVGGWLFRVAVRLSARTRDRVARPVGPVRPEADPSPGPVDRAAWQDLVAVLDTEIAALPETVRAALVCCYYEGLTQDEAADRLGWKVRTVRARVARGRSILQARLARRGVDLGAVLAAAAIGVDGARGLPPVGPILSIEASLAASPAVASLVREGVVMTGFASAKNLVIMTAALAAIAGIGYAIVVRPGDRGAGGPPSVVNSSNANPQPATLPKTLVDPVAIFNQAVDGCVYIVSETNGRTIEGTGALIDGEKRLVLTTFRTVGDSDVVSVQFPYHKLDGTIETDRTEYARSATAKLTPIGRVIHRDKSRDLALVQLDRLQRNAHSLELAEADIQETALHIGSGTGALFPMAVRKVIASPTNVSEQVKAWTITLSGTTDDSGGPLVDQVGKLVGLVVGAATEPKDGSAIVAIGIAEIRLFLADKDKPAPAPPAPKEAAPPMIPLPKDSGPSVDPIPGEFNAAFRELYEKCVDSTVFIVAPLQGSFSEGSGTLIDAKKRYVLMTYHLVEEAENVYCQFPVRLKDGSRMTDRKKYIERIPAGQAYKGKVLFRDKSRDLAIVQLDKLPEGVKALPLANKSALVGDTIISIGNPARINHTFTATQGHVRAVGVEDLTESGSGEPLRIKARTVAVTTIHGDSGGPIVDHNGRLVAVAESSGMQAQAISRGIDVTEVLAFLKEKKILIAIEPPDPKDLPKTQDKGNMPKADQPSPKGEPAPPAQQPSPEDEKAAAQLLLRAKLFADDADNRPIYVSRLKNVIGKYPGTAVAKEAQKLLDALK
jgi:RNA polymerase sigma factor (sigma-70 family)